MTKSDLYLAECAADLIGTPMRLSLEASSKTLADNLKAIARNSFGMSVRGLIREVGLPGGKSLGNIRRFSPSVFLDLMCRLGVKPSQFLAGDAIAKPTDEAAARPKVGKRPHLRQSEVTALRGQVEVLLQAALKAGSTVSWTTLAQQVGVSPHTLARRMPDLRKRVVAHSAATKQAHVAAVWEEKRRVTFAAVERKVRQGVPANAANIDRLARELHIHRLSPRGGPLMNEALNLWHDLTRQLPLAN